MTTPTPHLAIVARAPRTLAIAIAAIAVAVLAACGTSAQPTSTPPASTGAGDAITAASVTPILATTVLRTGSQRFAFILEGKVALITIPTVSVSARPESTDTTPGSPANAVFSKWPFGTRGSYVAELAFDAPGTWLIAIESDAIDGVVEFPVEIASETSIPEIGAVPPFSNTKTLETTQGDFVSLTSHQRPDPDLYAFSIAKSLFSGRPSVIVFASPAFCTSPTCGPQVDTIVDLKNSHPDDAEFIHVEIFDNPEVIQGDLSRGVLSPHLAEWGIDKLPDYNNESWTFVLGRDARITHRFEGYVTLEELEIALQEALG